MRYYITEDKLVHENEVLEPFTGATKTLIRARCFKYKLKSVYYYSAKEYMTYFERFCNLAVFFFYYGIYSFSK